MKIAVIGYSGAGKSTLARELGRRYGCPVLHLDQVQFTAGWAERDRGEALAMVEKFMEHVYATHEEFGQRVSAQIAAIKGLVTAD